MKLFELSFIVAFLMTTSCRSGGSTPVRTPQENPPSQGGGHSSQPSNNHQVTSPVCQLPLFILNSQERPFVGFEYNNENLVYYSSTGTSMGQHTDISATEGIWLPSGGMSSTNKIKKGHFNRNDVFMSLLIEGEGYEEDVDREIKKIFNFDDDDLGQLYADAKKRFKRLSDDKINWNYKDITEEKRIRHVITLTYLKGMAKNLDVLLSVFLDPEKKVWIDTPFFNKLRKSATKKFGSCKIVFQEPRSITYTNPSEFVDWDWTLLTDAGFTFTSLPFQTTADP